jgi:hypothetical protein
MAKQTLGSPQGPTTGRCAVWSGKQTMRRENRPLAYHTTPSIPPRQRYGVETQWQSTGNPAARLASRPTNVDNGQRCRMRCSLQELGMGDVSHSEGVVWKKESRARPPEAARVPKFRATSLACGARQERPGLQLSPRTCLFLRATPTFFYSSDPDSWVKVLFSVGGENIVHRFCAHRSLILRELFREIHRLLQSRVRFLLQGLRLFRALIASAPRTLSIPFRIRPARVSSYVLQSLAFLFSWERRGHADAMVARSQPDNWMLRLAQTFFPSPNRCYGPGTRL